MKKITWLLIAIIIGVAACASQAVRQDCLERKARADRAAAVAAQELKPGWTAAEVRGALGNPDEIVAAKEVGQFDIWKYYLWEDCRSHLGVTAPETDLFFLNGNLVTWTTHNP